MPSTVTWSAAALPLVLPDCASWTYMSPVDLNYGPSHPGDPLAPISLVQTCTGFSTSTYDPYIETFTISLKDNKETRTQTVPATTETWANTFARFYTIEYLNEFFTGDATVVTQWPGSTNIGTTTTRSSQTLDSPSATSQTPAGATATTTSPFSSTEPLSESTSLFSTTPPDTMTSNGPSIPAPTSPTTLSVSSINSSGLSWTLSAPIPSPVSSSHTSAIPDNGREPSPPSSPNTAASKVYTAALPAVLGTFILATGVLLLRHYRRRRKRYGTGQPSSPGFMCRAWHRLSSHSSSPSDNSHCLVAVAPAPAPTPSKEDPPECQDRGRPRMTRVSRSEERRSSLLRRARDRFIARESALSVSPA